MKKIHKIFGHIKKSSYLCIVKRKKTTTKNIKGMMYIVYETDEWLTNASKEFCGIFSSKEDAINSIVCNHNICLADTEYDTDEELIDYIKNMLEEHDQTQGLNVNYMIESAKVDNWEIGMPSKKIDNSSDGAMFLTNYNYSGLISLGFVCKQNEGYYHDIACQMVRNKVTDISKGNKDYHLDEIKDKNEIERYINIIRDNSVIQECLPMVIKNHKFYYLTTDVSSGHYILSVVITYEK